MSATITSGSAWRNITCAKAMSDYQPPAATAVVKRTLGTAPPLIFPASEPVAVHAALARFLTALVRDLGDFQV